MRRISAICWSPERPGLEGQSMLATVATQAARNSRGGRGGRGLLGGSCLAHPVLREQPEVRQRSNATTERGLRFFMGRSGCQEVGWSAVGDRGLLLARA